MSKDTSEDLYNVLGVPVDASEDDIKAAFRKGAKKHHPDGVSELPCVFLSFLFVECVLHRIVLCCVLSLQPHLVQTVWRSSDA